MRTYLDLVQRILDHGVMVPTRTGVNALSVFGEKIEHDMAQGFPLLTTKKMYFRGVAVELEAFMRGITDKRWLQERKCRIWDEWGNPASSDPNDLGPFYGFQWRHFGASYPGAVGLDIKSEAVGGVDQLANAIRLLKEDPSSRKNVVSAWNPVQLKMMALEPCHMIFQLRILDGRLHLMWFQRSVDTMLGLPFNLASYALLLHLIAKEVGVKEGRVIGVLGDTHIYENHLDGAKEQLGRDPDKYPLPGIETDPFTGALDWEWSHSRLVGYESYPPIKMDVAV